MDNSSGIVWLPGGLTFYLLDTIVVWENIILDMQGSEFRLPEGTDCHVVELKNRAGIKNGVINVAGHQAHGTSERTCSADSCYMTNTSFNVSN